MAETTDTSTPPEEPAQDEYQDHICLVEINGEEYSGTIVGAQTRDGGRVCLVAVNRHPNLPDPPGVAMCPLGDVKVLPDTDGGARYWRRQYVIEHERMRAYELALSTVSVDIYNRLNEALSSVGLHIHP